MKKTKILSIFMAFMMLVSALAMLGGLEAYAATLSKPTVTLSNASATSVKVSWKKVTGAKKYTVYRSTSKSSGYKAIKTTTSTSFASSSLTCGKTYYFKVKAINGSKSATSSVKSISVKPPQVKNVKVTKGCTYLKASWDKSSGASGYEVYSSTSSSGSFSKLATTTSLSYKNTGLKFSATKYYKVRAYKTVSGKKIYGSYSAVISGKTYSAHAPASSWIITKKATCAASGTKTNTCKYCSKTITEVIPKNDDHSFVASTVEKTEENCPYTKYTCSQCGYEYNSEIKKHKYEDSVTDPTCTKKGYTTHTCTRTNCDHSYNDTETEMIDHDYQEVEVKATCTAPSQTAMKCTVCEQYDPNSEFIPVEDSNPLGHTITTNSKTTEEGYIVPICDVCDAEVTEKTDYTCYIDLTSQTVSVPAAASFGSSSSVAEGTINKLDLRPDDKTKEYEITGSAKNLTIDVNANRNIEIKLNGVSIKNDSMDCFDIKNKAEADETGAVKTPTVSISAKDSTNNELTATTSGNAIESSCNLELKGHGKLEMNTVSTSISCAGKMEIKNLNLVIVSGNRGIDTKYESKNDTGMIISTDYSSITIKPNATISITSGDDGIRCKNMEITALSETDVDSDIYIKSGADGIQLEGKTGVEVHSGKLTIDAGKYAFNCSLNKVKFDAGVSSANCKGKTAFSKPAKEE